MAKDLSDLSNTEVWMIARNLRDDYPVIDDLMEMALMANSTGTGRDYRNAMDLLREALEDIDDNE